MGCGKCDLYSRGLGRCRLGKVNPRTKANTKEAMKFYGPSGICLKNKWRTKALIELHLLQLPALDVEQLKAIAKRMAKPEEVPQ